MPTDPIPHIHAERLPNGLTLLFEPMPWLRSISMGLLVPMGAATDPDGFEGSATIHSEWSLKGAGELDARAFSTAIDSLGVRRGASADRNTTNYGASLLVDTLPQALPLLASQVREPRLAEADFEKTRQLGLQELASLVDHVLGTAVFPLVPRGTWPATLEFKLNYLAPTRPGVLRARSQVVSLSKRTAVVSVECDNDGRPVGTALGTIALTPPRPAG